MRTGVALAAVTFVSARDAWGATFGKGDAADGTLSLMLVESGGLSQK